MTRSKRSGTCAEVGWPVPGEKLVVRGKYFEVFRLLQLSMGQPAFFRSIHAMPRTYQSASLTYETPTGTITGARPQHAFLSGPCRAGEQRRYRAEALRRPEQ